MTLLLDTGFENGLAPGGLGFELVKIPGGASLSALTKKHGSNGCLLTSSGSGGPYLSKTANVGLITGSVYYTPRTAFGTGTVAMLRGFILGGSPGKWLQINQRNSGKLNASIVNGAASTTGVDSTTTLVINTQYLIDYRFDCSGTTWKLDYRISDTNGTVLFTAAQITLTGQVASVMLELRQGPDGSTNYIVGFDDHRLTDQSVDYPIGAHTSDDTEVGGRTTFPPSWLDNHTQITTSKVLAGFNCPFNGTYPAPYKPVFIASEGSTKANRKNYFTTIDYTQCTPPANLYMARQVMNGNLWGEPRAVIVSGLGFDGFTTDWPAGGCAAFTSGSMDTTLDAWVTLFATLPDWPFVFRLWREMNSSATIYGAHGSTITPHTGLNETSGTAGTYCTAWNYVANYFKTRNTNIRMMWDPQTGDGAGGLATTSALAAWYPGDTHVDINGVNAYVAAPSRTIGQACANFKAGFGMTSGTVSTKPAIVCETQVDNSDATRITDFQQYTTDFTAMNGEFMAVNFWDSIGGQYEIKDSPSGYLAAFQAVVAAAPFDGVASVVYADTAGGTVAVTGTRAESYSHLSSFSDTPTGTLALSGVLAESFVGGGITWPAPGGNGRRGGSGANGNRKHELIADGAREAG